MRHLLTILSFFAGTICANAQFADAGPDQSIYGSSTVLAANVPGPGESGVWSVMEGAALFVDASDATTAVSGLGPGENILMWSFNSAAGASTSHVSIWSYDPNEPPAFAGPDQMILGPPFSATMSAIGCSGSACTCQWTMVAGSGVISNPNDPFATITGLSAGTTTLAWTCNNGPCGITTDQMGINAFVWMGVEDAGKVSSMLRYNSANWTLSLGGDIPLDAIEITDLSGRVLRSLPLNVRTWDLSDLPDGIVTVRATANGRIRSLRCAIVH